MQDNAPETEKVAEPAQQSATFKLNVGRTILVGMAFFSICMFWDLYDSLLPLMLANFSEFDGKTSLIGLIMALDNILALVLLPFLGMASDRFKSKFGKRMPFIVVGTILAAGSFLLINYAHQQHMLVLLLVSTAFTLLFMCSYRTPAVALMPDVTPKPLRSKGNAVINIMGVLGGVTSMVLSLLLKDSYKEEIDGRSVTILGIDNTALFFVVAGIMLLAVAVMIFKVRENRFVEEKNQLLQKAGYIEDDEDESEDVKKQKEIEEGGKLKKLGLTKAQFKSFCFLLVSVFLWFFAYNGCKTYFSTFAFRYLGMDGFELPLIIGQVFGFAAFVPAAMLGGKLGRKKTIIIGILGLIAAFAIASILVLAVPLEHKKIIEAGLYVCFAIVGAGWAFINVHSFVMVVEFSNKRNIGIYTGIYYAFSMTAQSITPVIMGFILDIPNAGLKLMFPYALFFALASLTTMLFVRHGNVKPELPKSKLEMLDN